MSAFLTGIAVVAVPVVVPWAIGYVVLRVDAWIHHTDWPCYDGRFGSCWLAGLFSLLALTLAVEVLSYIGLATQAILAAR